MILTQLVLFGFLIGAGEAVVEPGTGNQTLLFMGVG